MPSGKGSNQGSSNSKGDGSGRTSNSSNKNSKNQSGQRASSSRSQVRNDEQQSDERTPLLNRNRQEEEQDQDGYDSDASSNSDNDDDGNDQDTIVSNLGDFTVQPRDLANCLADKDIDGLLKLGSSSEGRSSSQDRGSTKSLLDALQTDEKNGLANDQCSEDGAKERIRVYGRNKLPEREMKSFLRFLWEAFCDKVLIILTIAAAVSFALGMWQDFGPHHDPKEPRVNWVEGVAISMSSCQIGCLRRQSC